MTEQEQDTAAAREQTQAVQELNTSLAADPITAQRVAFYRSMTALCRRAITNTPSSKRPYVLVEVKGERPGGWVEVYPGVKGQPVAFGRRMQRNAAGAIEQLRLTRVKVCARTMLTAMERGIATLPPELRAQVQEG
jgi:hypothetical protein